jgi:hypothetical protein
MSERVNSWKQSTNYAKDRIERPTETSEAATNYAAKMIWVESRVVPRTARIRVQTADIECKAAAGDIDGTDGTRANFTHGGG